MTLLSAVLKHLQQQFQPPVSLGATPHSRWRGGGFLSELEVVLWTHGLIFCSSVRQVCVKNRRHDRETFRAPRTKGHWSAVKEFLRRKGENKQNTSIRRDLGFGRCWSPSSHWRTLAVHSHTRSQGSIYMSLREKGTHTEESVVPSGAAGSPSAPRKGRKGNITFGTAPVVTKYPKN